MFVAAEAVQGVRDVELQIETAFGGGHNAEFFRGLDDPLALLAVADHVGLEHVGPVVFRVAREGGFGLFVGLEVGVGEDAGTGGEGPRSEHTALVDRVLVGEHVGGHGLGVPTGRDAIGEVGEEAPGLFFDDVALDAPVGVDVDDAGHDRVACDVLKFRARGDGEGSAFADGGDAVFGDEDVSVFDYLGTFHRDQFGVAEEDGARGLRAGGFDDDRELLGLRF